jgi:ubiquinone/menaquinone biosynthesis C-methylase UbiE
MARESITPLAATIRLVVVALLLLAATPSGAQPPQAQPNRHTLFPPTDLSLLESPDRDIWQKPDQVMDALGIADGSRVADIGAGGGYFTMRLARRVGPNGIVWAEDVQADMIEAIKRRVAKDVAKDLRNVVPVNGTSSDPMLPEGKLDAVLILETYQEIGNPLLFLQNVRKALRPGGRVGIIDYKQGGKGPGPDGERPVPEEVIAKAEQAGLRLLKRETFLPFQFFLIFVK